MITRRSVLAASAAAPVLLHALPANAATGPSAIVDASIGRGQAPVVSAAGFVHPGVVQARSDLDRMRDGVQQGREPWRAAFEWVRADPRSDPNYQLLGPIADVHGYNLPLEYTIGTDGFAAHMQAVCWYITGDQRYLAKSLQIIREWSAVLIRLNEGIHAAPGVARLVSAAEILRYTNGSGWTQADTTSFSRLLRVVMSAPDTGIDKPSWFMNQAGYAHTALLAAAVFLDDRENYAKYLHRLTVGDNPDPGRDISLDRQIRDNGQVNEIGRDQPHAHGDLTTLAELGQTAWIQTQGGRLGNLAVDLFGYRDNRLLSGAEFFATYNLGFEVPWTDHFVSGTEWYRKPAPASRGIFAELMSETNTYSQAATLLYWHYRYLKGVRDSQMPHLARLAAMIPPDWNTLLWAPKDLAARGRGAGAPGPAADVAPNAAYERFQAAGWSAASGKDQVRNDPWQDADGSRLIVRDIQENAWIEYRDFDFGQTPRGTFLLRGGASTKVPTKVAIHLDTPDGELLGTATIAATGWYTVFETTVTQLSRPLTGRHTLVLVFSGSSNVYHWQGAVDWIKVAAGSAHALNDAATAPEQTATSDGPDGAGRTLGVGASLGWRDLDFDNGRLSVLLNVQTTSPVTLELRLGTPSGKTIDRYDLPDTDGEWTDLERAGSKQQLLGRKDVFLVQTAGEAAAIKTVRWSEGIAPYPARPGVQRLATIAGDQPRETRDGLAIAADSTTATRPVTFKSGAAALAITYSAKRESHVEVRSDDPSSAVIAAGLLPATPRNEQRTVELPLQPSPTREHMLLLHNDAALTLVSLQADPVLSNPPRLELVGPADATVGQESVWTVVTTDPDGHRVTVTATTLPKGAVYDARAKAVRWSPRDTGTGTFVLLADDGSQLSTFTQTLVVHS